MAEMAHDEAFESTPATGLFNFAQAFQGSSVGDERCSCKMRDLRADTKPFPLSLGIDRPFCPVKAVKAANTASVHFWWPACGMQSNG
jgi:hypothetical protein